MKRLLAPLCGALATATLQGVAFSDSSVLVQSQTPGLVSYRIDEYDNSGALLQSLVPEIPPASSDLWNARDLAVDPAGRLQHYNGTFDPYLSTLDPVGGSWSHRTFPGWSTINNVSYGGLAVAAGQVFVTSMATSGDPLSGVIGFDLDGTGSTAFAATLSPIDLNIGLDGKLWVLQYRGGTAYAYDPATRTPLGSVTLTGASGLDPRSIAVAANGDIFVGTWAGTLVRLDSSGAFLDETVIGSSIIDIDLSPTGAIAAGTRLDGVWLTDTAFTEPEQLLANRWNSFVTFVPEPSTYAILTGLLALAVAAVRRNRTHGRGDQDGA